MIVIRPQVAGRHEGRTSPFPISWGSWATRMVLENLTLRSFDLPGTILGLPNQEWLGRQGSLVLQGFGVRLVRFKSRLRHFPAELPWAHWPPRTSALPVENEDNTYFIGWLWGLNEKMYAKQSFAWHSSSAYWNTFLVAAVIIFTWEMETLRQWVSLGEILLPARGCWATSGNVLVVNNGRWGVLLALREQRPGVL